DEPVLVIFGDCLYDSRVPASAQIIETFEKYSDPVIGLSSVDKKEVSKFGVIDGVELDKSTWEIKKMIEKPSIEQAPTTLVAVGKYVITSEVFEILSKMKYGKSGEIRLADAFDIMLSQNKPLYGKILKGEWLDTGNKLNFMKASIHLGLKHPEIKRELKKYIRSLDL
ncbi:MAG TPA: UTP--glucose-1-phosphate uridylyltransferase, partial [Candidatus Moranbacteria bacterium]|nr:UTP--glucose-1-phosphate uridylyltransferase [Candidatus Moranbacteria bacterium]